MKRKIMNMVQYDYTGKHIMLQVDNHKAQMESKGYKVKDAYWVDGCDEPMYSVIYIIDLLGR